MLATSRMWRSTRLMFAVWWRRPRAGAPAGGQRQGRPMPLQITFPRRRLRRVHMSFLRPIRRWLCLIRRSRAVEAGQVVEPAVEAAEAGAVVPGAAAPEVAARAVEVA